MAGHRFCVHVVAAGFVAAAGSLALTGLSAVASAEPDGGGSHGSASSHDSTKAHSSSGGGQGAGGSGASGLAGAGAARQPKGADASGVSTPSVSGASTSARGGAESANNNSGGAKVSAGQDVTGRSVAPKPGSATADINAGRSASASESGGADAKPVTKSRALTDPKPDTSGISHTPSVDGSVAAASAGVVQTAVSAVQHPVDGHSLQPNARQKNISAAVDAQETLPGDNPRVKQAGAEMLGRASGGSVSGVGRKAQVKAATSAAESASKDAPTVDKAGNAVTSTVRIAHAFPSTSAITDVKAPEHLTTVQIPARSRLSAQPDVLAVPATVAVAAVTAPAAPVPAPVAPVGPLPVPVVPANAPTAPGGAMASISSALADVRKRSEGSGDTVTQEPVNSEQALHVQNVSAVSVTEGSVDAVDTAHGQVVQEQVGGIAEVFETAAVQDAEDAPRIRVRRDLSSATAASSPDAFAEKVQALKAERVKLVADSAALRAKHDALTADRLKLEAAIAEHNKGLPGIEATDRELQQENAELTAAILAHNAAVAAGGGSNAEATALGIQQASLNLRITLHTQYKLYYNAEGARLNAEQASVNARADENLAEGIRLQQRDLQMTSEALANAGDAYKANLDQTEWDSKAQNLANIAAQQGVPVDQLPRTPVYELNHVPYTGKLGAEHEAELARQLKLWEHGFNTQTVAQALDNLANPRPSSTELRNQFRQGLQERTFNDLLEIGYGPQEAAMFAEEYALKQFPKESGLITNPVIHNPDMAIGGPAEAGTYGDWQVNNALGTLTKQERDAFIAWLKTQDPQAVLNVKMVGPSIND